MAISPLRIALFCIYERLMLEFSEIWIYLFLYIKLVKIRVIYNRIKLMVVNLGCAPLYLASLNAKQSLNEQRLKIGGHFQFICRLQR